MLPERQKDKKEISCAVSMMQQEISFLYSGEQQQMHFVSLLRQSVRLQPGEEGLKPGLT